MKVQRTADDVGELFVVMVMRGHEVALLEEDLRDHHAIAGDQLAGDRALQFFLGNFGPAVMLERLQLRHWIPSLQARASLHPRHNCATTLGESPHWVGAPLGHSPGALTLMPAAPALQALLYVFWSQPQTGV